MTHLAKESEGSETFGTLAYVILGTLGGVTILLDIITIGKHIGILKENICGQKKEDSPETSKDNKDGGVEDV